MKREFSGIFQKTGEFSTFKKGIPSGPGLNHLAVVILAPDADQMSVRQFNFSRQVEVLVSPCIARDKIPRFAANHDTDNPSLRNVIAITASPGLHTKRVGYMLRVAFFVEKNVSSHSRALLRCNAS